MGEEVLDLLVARVEELDEDEDAIAWEVGGVAELLDLTFREGVVVALGVEGQRRGRGGRRREGADGALSASVLVFDDFGK